MGIGERIAEERKRLGLSQAAFAELVGVSFSSQRRYENETRVPDTDYVSALSTAGIDVGYVLSGQRLDQRQKECLEDELPEFGRAFAHILGISEADLIQASESVDSRMKEHNADFERSGMVESAKWRSALQAEFLIASAPLVEGSPKIRELVENQLDMGLLADVIEQVEALLPTIVAISAAKKARVIAMLFRAFKASGKIDQAMVKEVVKLASE